MKNDAHVLLIGHDVKFCRLTSEYLADFGVKDEAAHNGPDALESSINEMRNRDYEVYDRSGVHKSALRRKLNNNFRHPKYIKTIRDIGYLLIHEVEA